MHKARTPKKEKPQSHLWNVWDELELWWGLWRWLSLSLLSRNWQVFIQPSVITGPNYKHNYLIIQKLELGGLSLSYFFVCICCFKKKTLDDVSWQSALRWQEWCVSCFKLASCGSIVNIKRLNKVLLGGKKWPQMRKNGIGSAKRRISSSVKSAHFRASTRLLVAGSIPVSPRGSVPCLCLSIQAAGRAASR